jgi:hypothetical protein
MWGSAKTCALVVGFADGNYSAIDASSFIPYFSAEFGVREYDA